MPGMLAGNEEAAKLADFSAGCIRHELLRIPRYPLEPSKSLTSWKHIGTPINEESTTTSHRKMRKPGHAALRPRVLRAVRPRQQLDES